MSSRRALIGSTVLVAVLLTVALGCFARAQSRLKGYPGREIVAAGLADRFAAVQHGAESLSRAFGGDEAQGAREGLGHAVTGFDQALQALAHGGAAPQAEGAAIELPVPTVDPAAAFLEEALHAWSEVEPQLADLAGERYAPGSPEGREAQALLMVTAPHLVEALGAARTAIEARGAAGRKLLHASVLASAALGSTLLALGGALTLSMRGQWTSIKLPKRKKKEKEKKENVPDAAPRVRQHLPQPEPDPPVVVRRVEPTPEPPRFPTPTPAPLPPAPVARPAFTPPMDLDLASASVDKVVVDMATIAGTTAKLQAAIDAVASAMQGMLFSLTEMAQDTGEGVRITRTANNAATYSAEAARELVASAREMAQIVGRVQQLAQHSQEIARQVEDDAAQTGATGEAFTTVVAGEVRKLAYATAAATQQIEATVAEILGSQRQYEEAIGQVIKNVSAIHRVCAHLGELMLDPPARVQPGAAVSYAPPPPPPPPPAPAPAPPPAPPVVQAPPPAPEPAPAPPTPEPAPAVTPVQAEVEARVESELTIDLIMPEPSPPPAPEPEPIAPPPPAPAVPAAPSAAPAAPAGSNANVFILKPKKRTTGDAPAPTPAPTPAPAPAAAAPEPEPEPVLVGGGGEEQAEKKEKPAGQGASGNIFMLNKKKK
jgi:hypothetical protein